MDASMRPLCFLCFPDLYFPGPEANAARQVFRARSRAAEQRVQVAQEALPLPTPPWPDPLLPRPGHLPGPRDGRHLQGVRLAATCETKQGGLDRPLAGHLI